MNELNPIDITMLWPGGLDLTLKSPPLMVRHPRIVVVDCENLPLPFANGPFEGWSKVANFDHDARTYMPNGQTPLRGEDRC